MKTTDVQIYWYACYDEIDDKLRVWKLSGKPWGKDQVQLTYVLHSLCNGARRVPVSYLSASAVVAVTMWTRRQESLIWQASRRLDRERAKLRIVMNGGYTEHDLAVAKKKKKV